MNTQLKAVLVLVAMTAAWLVISLCAGEMRGLVIFGYTLVGQLSMALVLWLAQRHDRLRDTKRKGALATLAFLLPGLAKAIIPIVIAVGVAVGLLGWAGIAIWSKALSIKLNELKRPIHLAMTSVTDLGIAIAAAAPPEQEPGFALAADNPPQTEPAFDFKTYGIPILVPSHYYLQFSTNMVDWSDVHYSPDSDELTFWEPQGTQGFFRYKTFETDVPPTMDATQ